MLLICVSHTTMSTGPGHGLPVREVCDQMGLQLRGVLENYWLSDDSYEEFTRLAETRLAQNMFNYINNILNYLNIVLNKLKHKLAILLVCFADVLFF